MSGIRIGSNISSLQAQRALSGATSRLTSTFERLSSGQRITRASDDAAGLAVSTSLNSTRRVYNQGLRNLADGISALNICDGAMEALSNIVMRLQELAEQDANGSLGAKQRKSINDEAQALAKEYSRISQTTQFNGLKLLNGSVDGLSLQAGYGTSGALRSNTGGAMGTGSFSANGTYDTVGSLALGLADLNGDGATDMVTGESDWYGGGFTVRLGVGDGTFSSGAARYVSGGSGVKALSLADLNADGVADVVGAGENGVEVRLGRGDGTFGSSVSYSTPSGARVLALSVLDTDGVLDLVTAGYNTGATATVRLGKGDGTFSSVSREYTTEPEGTHSIALADINADGRVDMVTGGWQEPSSTRVATVRLGLGNGTFAANTTTYDISASGSQGLALSDLNGDGRLDMASVGWGGTMFRLGKSDGTFSAPSVTYSDTANALLLADISGDGLSDLILSTGVVRLGKGDGTFSSPSPGFGASGSGAAVALSDLNSDGVPDVVTTELGWWQTGGPGVSVFLAKTRDGVSPLLPFDLSTMYGARQALPLFKQKLDQLSAQRGILGALEARVSSAINTVKVSSENYTAAASRITDADIAQESSSLVRTQILQQAAAAVLGQTNLQPSIALKLLT